MLLLRFAINAHRHFRGLEKSRTFSNDVLPNYLTTSFEKSIDFSFKIAVASPHKSGSRAGSEAKRGSR